jgi:hypothetical protein
MKKFFALSAASVLMTAPAMAGQFVNVEANSSIQDGDYSSTRIDTQYGWEGTIGEDSKYYVQGGPSFLSRDGAEDLEYQVGGKVGIKTALTEDVTAYSELKAYSAEDWDLNDIKLSVKAGVKYTF